MNKDDVLSDPSSPLNFTEEEMKHLGKTWSKIYKRFLEDVDDLIAEAGGSHMLQITEYGDGGIRNLIAKFG